VTHTIDKPEDLPLPAMDSPSGFLPRTSRKIINPAASQPDSAYSGRRACHGTHRNQWLFAPADFPWLKSRKIRSLIFEKENTKKHKAPGKQNENAEKEQNL
jgi:hypothetical protein